MATPTNTPVVKQIRDSANALHDIAALYLTDGMELSTNDVYQLIEKDVDMALAQQLKGGR